MVSRMEKSIEYKKFMVPGTAKNSNKTEGKKKVKSALLKLED